MIQKPVIFSSLIFLFSCSNSNSNFKYIKLKDYNYTKATIKPFAEIELLSVSGGKKCTNDEIYFYQFVGILKETNDTVRILSPCQEYDEVKALRAGSFIPMDDTSPAGINKFMDPSGKNNIDEDKIFVVVNKNHFTETGNYKTIIGGIGFKD